MVILIVTREDTYTLNILDALSKKFPEISSLYYCVNPKLNDSYFDLDFQCYRGDEKLLQTLGHIRFMLGPKSFFQTNPEQAQALYDTALDFAELSGDDLVYDLYCGIGSITLYMAHQCRHVVGIEEIPEAIADARENAGLNQISNVTFYAGDVKEVLGEIREKHGAPDIVITDPPRAGMHTSAIQHLIDLAPQKIVYVSCNPATQARDIGLLSDDYQFVKARPLDMFPHTSHIENVVLLTRN